MALFGNDRSSSSSPSSPAASQAHVSLVAEGTVFDGTLKAESDVRISGDVIGRIDVKCKVVVAESGTVDGEVHAAEASIAGQVSGDIVVEGRLILRETARVDGNIQADRLVVEDGAAFTGECSMSGPLPESSSDGSATEDNPVPEVSPPENGATSPASETAESSGSASNNHAPAASSS